MRARTILMLIASAGAPAFAADPAGDFRAARWGMSQAEVRASEPGEPRTAKTGEHGFVLYYSGQFEGQNVNITYAFFDDKLTRARYQFTAKHDKDLNDFIADYRAIEPLLRASFGDPHSEEAVWVDDSLQEERKSYLEQDRAKPSDILPSDRNVGLAVSVGNLKMYTGWIAGRSRVLHALWGTGGAITHEIDYSPADPTGNPSNPSSDKSTK